MSRGRRANRTNFRVARASSTLAWSLSEPPISTKASTPSSSADIYNSTLYHPIRPWSLHSTIFFFALQCETPYSLRVSSATSSRRSMPQPNRKTRSAFTPPKGLVPKKDYTPRENPHPKKAIKPDLNRGSGERSRIMSQQRSALVPPTRSHAYDLAGIDMSVSYELTPKHITDMVSAQVSTFASSVNQLSVLQAEDRDYNHQRLGIDRQQLEIDRQRLVIDRQQTEINERQVEVNSRNSNNDARRFELARKNHEEFHIRWILSLAVFFFILWIVWSMLTALSQEKYTPRVNPHPKKAARLDLNKDTGNEKAKRMREDAKARKAKAIADAEAKLEHNPNAAQNLAISHQDHSSTQNRSSLELVNLPITLQVPLSQSNMHLEGVRFQYRPAVPRHSIEAVGPVSRARTLMPEELGDAVIDTMKVDGSVRFVDDTEPLGVAGMDENNGLWCLFLFD
ncbi:hypothetical protein VTL71DRAFT_11212 [Oculimacula yallundae]|uniref:Uncharacterized protein n=1 Tax=Oculimacula yallundae TaxID=86028 RepID=A0ABR4CVB6_9HELO